jgi:hypothetical protein
MKSDKYKSNMYCQRDWPASVCWTRQGSDHDNKSEEIRSTCATKNTCSLSCYQLAKISTQDVSKKTFSFDSECFQKWYCH